MHYDTCFDTSSFCYLNFEICTDLKTNNIRGSHYGAKTILARKKCIIGAKETHFPILLSVFFAVIILKHVGEPNKHGSETNKKVLTLDQMTG